MRKVALVAAALVLMGISVRWFWPSAPITNADPAGENIICFGDSLTFGTGAPEGSDYPSRLSDLISIPVINAGVPGEVTSAGLIRLPDLLDEFQPQLMILCHGGNDMLRKQDLAVAADNLRSMIRFARQRGVSVILIAVPRPGLLLSPPEFYQQVAEEMGVPIEIDVLSELLSDRSLKSDVIHPNSEGYRMVAEALFQLMKDTGAVRRK